MSFLLPLICLGYVVVVSLVLLLSGPAGVVWAAPARLEERHAVLPGCARALLPVAAQLAAGAVAAAAVAGVETGDLDPEKSFYR